MIWCIAPIGEPAERTNRVTELSTDKLDALVNTRPSSILKGLHRISSLR